VRGSTSSRQEVPQAESFPPTRNMRLAGSSDCGACGVSLGREPREVIQIAAKADRRPKKKKARFCHTLCTCGANASKIARGYLIGLQQFFSAERCLHLTFDR
jgi:transposase